MAYASSPDRPPRSRAFAKIVIAGGFGTGKTTLVGAVPEIPPVSTGTWMTQAAKTVDRPRRRSRSKTTTVAMDFGRITMGDDLVLYLFGTPGQHVSGRCGTTCNRGASGALVLVDTRRLEVSFPAVNYFENDSDVPFIVAVNLFDGRHAHPLPEVRDALGLPPQVPLTTCDARDRGSDLRRADSLERENLRRRQQVGVADHRGAQ